MGKFSLMALTYAPEALEPVISRETIAFHHGKHLAAYVNNLNGLLGAMGSGTCAPFCHFLVENLVVWIKMLTFVPLIQI